MTYIPLVIALASVAGQDASGTSTPAAGARTVKIDVVAVDQKGVPVTDLRPAEFEVWISGYRVPVRDVYAVSPESHGRTIALVLDDAAVRPEGAIRVREAARQFVTRMAPGDRLAIVPLHDGVPEFTDDRAALLRAIDAYHVRGFPFRVDDAGRRVLGRIALLSRQFPEVSGGRRTIVGIGTGWLFDTPLPPPGLHDLHAEWVAAMRAMASANASLYVIDPAGISVQPRPGGFGGDSGFARETGGHAFLNTNDVSGAAARIRAEAGSYYVLAVSDPPVQRTAELREVEVKVLRKGVTVRARRGITGKP